MGKDRHTILGRFGEDLAVRYLEGKGYAVMKRNLRLGHLEIDIVAKNGNELVFAEVKTFLLGHENAADQRLSRAKIGRLKRALSAYTELHKIDPETVDIHLVEVAIDKNKKMANIKHYTSIF